MNGEPTIRIENALVVPNDPDQRPVFRGWVLIIGDRIANLGEGPVPRGRCDRVINADGSALIPGLVNTHAHSHSSLTRGSAEGLSLSDWLDVIENEQARLLPEQEYVGALATYAEALLSGTTLISDMCLHPQSALRAAREIGIRAVISPYVAETKAFTPRLRDTERLLSEGPIDGERVRIWCGLHDIESCGNQQIRKGLQLADRYNVGLHLHCAETQALVALTQGRTGHRPVAHLDHLGVLGPRTLLAHCVWVDDADMRRLADTGTSVAHCPHANLKLGSGIAPVPELVGAGVNVALATDGAKANNRIDMFDVMKLTSLLHKGNKMDPSLLPADAIIDMGTRAGAQALGVDAGAISPGRLADLTLVCLDHFHLKPAVPETIITNLVHAARGSDVELVMVGGRIVVEQGRLKTMDQKMILARLVKTGEVLMSI